MLWLFSGTGFCCSVSSSALTSAAGSLNWVLSIRAGGKSSVAAVPAISSPDNFSASKTANTTYPTTANNPSPMIPPTSQLWFPLFRFFNRVTTAPVVAVRSTGSSPSRGLVNSAGSNSTTTGATDAAAGRLVGRLGFGSLEGGPFAALKTNGSTFA